MASKVCAMIEAGGQAFQQVIRVGRIQQDVALSFGPRFAFESAENSSDLFLALRLQNVQPQGRGNQHNSQDAEEQEKQKRRHSVTY